MKRHLNNQLGEALQKLRKNRITQVALAKSVGVGQAHIAQIETQGKIPSLKVFLKIINTLQIESEEAAVLADMYTQIKYPEIAELWDKLPNVWKSPKLKHKS